MAKNIISICTGIVCTIRAGHAFNDLIDMAMFTTRVDAEAWADARIDTLLVYAKQADPTFDDYSFEADYRTVAFDPVVVEDE